MFSLLSVVGIVAGAVKQMEMQPGGQGYCSMAENESVAALPDGAALPEALDLVVNVPNWTVPEYSTR